MKYLLFSLLLSYNIMAEDFPPPIPEATEGLSEEKGVSKTEQESVLKDKLAIGGNLYSDMIYSMFAHQRFKNNVFTNPNLLWVYMDGKFPRDVRVFVKGRVLYNPTVTDNTVSALTGTVNQKTTASLDEMKVMFNSANKVFFTIGKQRIKHGSARIWNPTDFLNTTMRDPFYTYDRREGVNLVKAHIPINNSNLYLIGSIDNATNLDKIGYYARYELPFSASEFALSFLSKNNSATRIGFDFSSAFFGTDIYVETAFAKGSDKTLFRENNYIPGTYYSYTDKGSYFNKTSAGISYEMEYGDKDSMTFTLEYFYNGEGYTKPDVYPTLFYNNSLTIFNLGRHYGMFMLYLPKPGTWNRYTFIVLNIANMNDKSAITRFQFMKELTNDLSIGFNITGHYGNPSGEFKISNQMLDAGFRLEFKF